MTRISLIFLFLIILCSCQPTSSNSTVFDKKETGKEIKKTLQNYFNDIRKEGLNGEFKYLDASSDFFWVPPGYKSALSYDSVSTVLKETAGGFNSIDFQWQNLKINALSKEIGNYTGIVRGSMIDTSGKIFPVKMIESGTVIKRSDGWKILSGQSRNLVD